MNPILRVSSHAIALPQPAATDLDTFPQKHRPVADCVEFDPIHIRVKIYSVRLDSSWFTRRSSTHRATHCVGAAIVRLVAPRGPSAIARFVVPVYIYTLQR